MSELAGIYKAVVFDTDDPTRRGRCRLLVPAILGNTPTGWAEAVSASITAPRAGTMVWAMFEGGDVNRPVVLPTTAASLDGRSARAATTANITLSGLQTVDGVALAVGDLVLVWRQTTASQNGVYVASTGTWARDVMWDTARKVAQMKQIAVEEGTKYGGCIFETVDWKASNTLGTTGMLWTTDILATAQSDAVLIPFQSWTDVSLTETYDPQGIYAAPVYTIPVRGLWEVQGGIYWSTTRAGATSHLLYAAVYNNTIEITRWSSEVSVPASGQGTAGSETFVFNAGDTIKFRAYQDGTNGNLQATSPTSRVRLIRTLP